MFPTKQYVSGTGNGKNLSSVAQTCNQLSLFLKDKGGCLKDLHFGITSKFDDSVKSGPPPTTSKSTIDLLSNMENLGQNNYGTNDNKTPAVSATNIELLSSKTTSKQTMSIFYKGQVMVVDDISEDRAKEVFIIAAAAANSSAATLLSNQPKVASSEPAANLGSNNNNNNNNNQRRIEHAQLQPNNGGLDLPIARRASLHKFLAKRRDRAHHLRPEPYHLLPNTNNHHPSSSGSTGKNEHNFDLNL